MVWPGAICREGDTTKISAFLVLSFLLLSAQAATYKLHTVHSGSVPSRVRIVNLSDVYGVVDITGFDDQGEEYGPVELDLEAHASTILLTRELENGAPDKGLLYGLGNGSGQWQLELTTELEIGAVSFKTGVLSDVLSSAVLEQADQNLSPHFLWAHKLVDKGLSSPEFEDIHFSDRGDHELLSAYSWEPLDEVEGVVIGEGNYEHPRTAEAWRRLGGRLDYSFFAVQTGLMNGETGILAYSVGRSSSCLRPPDDAEYVGVAIYVTPQGEVGYGPATLTMHSTFRPEGGQSDQGVLTMAVSIRDAETQKTVMTEFQSNAIVLGYHELDIHQSVSSYGPSGHCTEIGGRVSYDGGYSFLAFGARRVESDDPNL